MEHIAVFHKELIEGLNVQAGGNYVDATLGAGGHSKSILARMRSGKLICFDLDQVALQNFASNCVPNYSDIQISLQNSNFSELSTVIEKLGLNKSLDGVIADLGWSSDQLSHLPGLSYQNLDQKLDMRFDQTKSLDAAGVLNNADYNYLRDMFIDLGGFRHAEAAQLAKFIIEQRKVKSIQTVGEFNNILAKVNSPRQHNILTRAYQALRITVNDEYENLRKFLDAAFDNLKAAGRLVVITFHSGEEELLAEFMEKKETSGLATNIFTTKYLQPTVAELRHNIRSHSAKLWGLQKK